MPNESPNSSRQKKSSGEKSAPKKSTTRKPSSKTTTNKTSSKKTVSKKVVAPVVESIKTPETPVVTSAPTSTPAPATPAPVVSKPAKENKYINNVLKNKKTLGIVAAAVAVLVLGVVAFAFMGGDNRKVLATFTDNDGKIVAVRISDVIDVLKPNLSQVPQEAIDTLEGIEPLRQVVQNAAVQPRFIVLEALNISNFRESENYTQQLQEYLKGMALNLANRKSFEQIYKDLSNQQLMVAAASRILINKSSDPEEDATILVRISNILQSLKESENVLQDFRAFATTDSQDIITRGMSGYMGEVIKGTFPELDDALFEKKSAEGLYPEVIVGPDSYQLVYVETPAKSGKMKDFPELQNGQSFQLHMVNFLNNNSQVLYSYDPATQTYFSEKNEPVNAETLTANTVVARFWKKNYTIAQVGEFILATAPQGALAPQPTEVVQLLSETNFEANYRIQLTAMLRSYSTAPDKELVNLSNTAVTQLDNESSYGIIEEYLIARIDTNVSAQETEVYYNSLPEKPIQDYRPDGTPVYATLAEATPQIQNTILGGRMQQEFLVLMSKASEERSLKWKEANFPVLNRVILKEYQKATAQQ
ncbi:MAG: hypothetical protein ACRCY4_10735 [Brevinema sp.]